MYIPPISTIHAYAAYQRRSRPLQRPSAVHTDTRAPRPALRRHTYLDIIV